MNKLFSIVTVAALLAVTTFSNIAAYAGPVGGMRSADERVWGYRTDVYRNVLRGGETTTITVFGDHDTDLDLYVYDENGNLIAKDEDSTDVCVVRIVPRWTGLFSIKVVNRGSVFNDYRIEIK